MDALITGGSGFIGSHLGEYLLSSGSTVTVLDDLSTGRLKNIEHLLHRPGFKFAHGSILDAELVDELMGSVDTVFHLAAAVGVNLIIEKPLQSLATNIRGSEVVLEKANKYRTRVLMTSTSEIYGKNTSDRLSEEDDRILGSPLKSRWSYAEAKAIDEILAYTYWKETGLPAVIVRLFNTVGPRQTGHYGMVIPRFVSQALSGEPLTVYGSGDQTRCFCHVSEIVKAMVDLVQEAKAYGQVFNLGSQEEVSVRELAERVIHLAQSDSAIELIPYEKAYEQGFEDMSRRVPDTTRARNLVGFNPIVKLDDIIRVVISEQRQRP